MIEPRHAARLGFSLRFAQDAPDDVEGAIARLQALGVQQVRLEFGAGDDAAWCSSLVGMFASSFVVCAAIHPSSDDALLAGVLQHKESLGSIEISAPVAFDGAERSVAQIGATLASIRGAGVAAVLAADEAAGLVTVLRLGGPTVASSISAFGLRVVLDGDSIADLHSKVAALRQAVGAYAPDHPIWLSQLAVASRPGDVLAQCRGFAAAAASALPRVYWNTLKEPAGARATTRHVGVDDAAGQPRVLGRLLERGVGEVDSFLALARKFPAPGIVGQQRPVLVTGGAGFIGTNLADRLAQEGHNVLIYDALARAGVEQNVRWLARRHPKKVSFVFGDLRDEAALADEVAHVSAIFHLAGQVAVTTSMVHPLADFEVNARGTVSLLEAVRQRNPSAPVVFASTNKVYGNLADIDLLQYGDCYLPASNSLRVSGVGEDRRLDFHTPYGCSKGAADQYVLDYAHSFGLKTAVLRMSCIYGEHQLGTEDQGWVAHFLLRAMAGEPLTIYGDGRQVRDILHVGDAVQAYMAVWRNIEAVQGRAYNMGGGPANAISLLQLVQHIESVLRRTVAVEFSDWRPGDQRYFVADTTALRRDLGLADPLNWRKGVLRLAEYFGAVKTDAGRKVEAFS